MNLKRNQRAILILLLIILVVALLLRVFNVGHVISWDEAWNTNTMIDGATGNTQDLFFQNFWRHPPLYTGLGIVYAAITGTGRVGLSLAMEIVSILFALLLILVLFLCGRDWFGEVAGLIAAFLFAVSPAARVFDSVVKQESMTLLLCLLFLLFFFRKRYIVAGIWLGLALLTKEITIFIPVALFIFLLSMRRIEEIKGFVLSAAVAIVGSGWWYLFFSESRGEFLNFFQGNHPSAITWHRDWNFYLGRIPSDLGWVAFLLAVLGIVVLIWHLHLFRGTGGSGDGFTARHMAIFLTIWIVIVYLVISVSYGKPPWMIYAALPAFAMLGGFGLAEGYRLLSSRSSIAFAALALTLVAALAMSISVGYGSYLESADVLYGPALRSKQVADYINQRTGTDGRVMFSILDYSPNLVFNLECYQPGSIGVLPEDPLEDEGEYPGFTIFLLDYGTTPGEAMGHIENIRPDFVLVLYRPNFTGKEITDIADTLRVLAEPVIIRDALIFEGEQIVEGLKRAGSPQ